MLIFFKKICKLIYLFSLNSIQFGIDCQFQWPEYTTVKNIQINDILLNNVHMFHFENF